jgi:hypothetical protein
MTDYQRKQGEKQSEPHYCLKLGSKTGKNLGPKFIWICIIRRYFEMSDDFIIIIILLFYRGGQE